MKGIPTVLLLVSFLARGAAAASGPAENDFRALFAKHWQVAKEFTLAVAEAMPAEGYDFKPNPEELTFGQLMIHIAAQNSDSCASATGRLYRRPLCVKRGARQCTSKPCLSFPN